MFKADLFKGKKFLVTGGGTGLGRSMTEKFVELGAEVVIIGRRKEMLDKAAEEITAKHGGKVTPIPCDIRVAEAIEDMVADVWRAGPLDGLINNAAGNFISQTKDLSPRRVTDAQDAGDDPATALIGAEAAECLLQFTLAGVTTPAQLLGTMDMVTEDTAALPG